MVKRKLRQAEDVPADTDRNALMADMAFDAMRIALCQRPRTYEPYAVIRWLQCCATTLITTEDTPNAP